MLQCCEKFIVHLQTPGEGALAVGGAFYVCIHTNAAPHEHKASAFTDDTMMRVSCFTCCPSVREPQITLTQVPDFSMPPQTPSSGGGEHDSGNGVVHERTGSKATPEARGINDLVNRVKPGELRAMFIANLRRCVTGSLESLSCSVRRAQVLLGGHRETGALVEEAMVLGDGGFGVVTSVRHTILPGDFALKRLKHVRGLQSARYACKSAWSNGCTT